MLIPLWGRLETCGRLAIGLYKLSIILNWPINNRPQVSNLPHKQDATLPYTKIPE
jgi:hypothetical protein